MRSLDDHFLSNNPQLRIQDCSTHCGLGISILESNYAIKVILSQKGIFIEESMLLKDGIIIKGQMLQPNSYLFAVNLIKNQKSLVTVGPSKINFNKETGNFIVCMSFKDVGTLFTLGMRKVAFFAKNTNNVNEIPYLDNNFKENMIPWDGLELLFTQVINFPKLKENKNEKLEIYLQPFENKSNNIVNEITNQNNNQQLNIGPNAQNNSAIPPQGNINMNNNTINNKENQVLSFDMSGNNNINKNVNNLHNSNLRTGNKFSLNSTNSKNNVNSFFNPNFLTNKNQANKGGAIVGSIPEENSIYLFSGNNSNLNSVVKLKNNLAGNFSNSKPSAFNPIFQDNNSLRNNNNNQRMSNLTMNNNAINNHLLNSNNNHKNANNPNAMQEMNLNNNNLLNNINQNVNNFIQNTNTPNSVTNNLNLNNLQNNINNVNMNSRNNLFGNNMNQQQTMNINSANNINPVSPNNVLANNQANRFGNLSMNNFQGNMNNQQIMNLQNTNIIPMNHNINLNQNNLNNINNNVINPNAMNYQNNLNQNPNNLNTNPQLNNLNVNNPNLLNPNLVADQNNNINQNMVKNFTGNNNISFNNVPNCINQNMMNNNNNASINPMNANYNNMESGNNNFNNNLVLNNPPTNASMMNNLNNPNTFYNSLFKNINHVTRAYRLDLSRLPPNFSVSDMLNILPLPNEDCMKNNINDILKYSNNENFIINLDRIKFYGNCNYTIRAKSRNEFVEFILSKIMNKKKRTENSSLDVNQMIIKNLAGEEQKINLLSNENNKQHLLNNYPHINSFDLNEKILNPDKNFPQINNINPIMPYPSLGKANDNILIFDRYNNMNSSNQFMNFYNENMCDTYENAYSGILKTSVKFYQRDRNALNNYYNAANDIKGFDFYNNCNLKDNEQIYFNNKNSSSINPILNNNYNKNFKIYQSEYEKFSKDLFKDDGNKNKNQGNNLNVNNYDDEKINVEKAFLESIAKNYLTENERLGKPNPLFLELYKSKKNIDLIFKIENEEISAHKIVVMSQSLSLKKIISDVERNQNSNGSNYNEIVIINFPSSFKKNIFKEILRWLYSRKFDVDNKFTINEYRELLLLANNLEILEFEKILIIKYIIPNMKKESCIRFTKDTYKKLVNESNKKFWRLLGDFSIYLVAKNFPFLIKNFRNQILGMEQELLFICVEEAISYTTDSFEVQNIIKLIIDTDYAFDIFDLLNKLSKLYVNAKNYNTQNFEIKSILNKIDCTKPIELPLINDAFIYSEKTCLFASGLYPCGCSAQNQEKYENCKKTNFIFCNSNKIEYNNNKNININNILTEVIRPEEFKNDFNLEINNFKNNSILHNPNKNIYYPDQNLNNNFELAKNKNLLNSLNIFSINKKDFLETCPSRNYINHNEIDLRIKSPNFTFAINLEENYQSCTILSEAFNTKQSSWHLKLDIDKEANELSIFLLERGFPINLRKNKYDRISRNSVKYNSVLFEIEVKNNNFEKSFMLFFSFLFNQNQIIGFDNFFNLNKIENKKKIYFNVWIKEFPFHSASLQYISDNFKHLIINHKNAGNDNKICSINNRNSIENLNKKPVEIINNNVIFANSKLNNNLDENNQIDYNLNNFYLKNNNLSNVPDKNTTNNNLNNSVINSTYEKRSIYDIDIWDLGYILYNDNLNIENENSAFSFLYKYCLKRTTKEIEMLMNTIRYRFVDFKLLCITARDHKIISKSHIYKKHFDYEVKSRLAKDVHFPNLKNHL